MKDPSVLPRRATLAELAQNLMEAEVLPTLIVDLDTLACEEAVAYEFRPEGCRLKNGRIREKGKTIGLRIAGYDHMIKGRVSEVLEDEVVIAFVFANDIAVEKRSERRRKVAIPVWVSAQGSEEGIRCKIIDASQSGCRLRGSQIEVLPEHISLQISGLDCPVPGIIVWRTENQAGVKLLWEFSSGGDLKKKSDQEKSDTVAQLEDKIQIVDTPSAKNGSGFGVRRRK